jgi:pyruvate ferredoxin oxidoreductase delta subunit
MKEVCEPGTTVVNRTGPWRIFKPVVNKEKCIGCGRCSLFCPDGVINVKDGKAEVDYDYCKGCGICSKVCPVKAITMEREVK